MSSPGTKTFRQKDKFGKDRICLAPYRGGVNFLVGEQVIADPAEKLIVLRFTPRRTRQIAKAMNRAADIAEEKT